MPLVPEESATQQTRPNWVSMIPEVEADVPASRMGRRPGRRFRPDDRTARERIADGLALLLVLASAVFLVGPILLLALFSFNDSSVIALPFEGFTLEWYREALADPAALTALANSVVAGVDRRARSASCWARPRRGPSPGSDSGAGAFWSGLVAVPLIVPWLVIGIAVCFLRQPGDRAVPEDRAASCTS